MTDYAWGVLTPFLAIGVLALLAGAGWPADRFEHLHICEPRQQCCVVGEVRRRTSSSTCAPLYAASMVASAVMSACRAATASFCITSSVSPGR
ncbi:hypothetical protein MMX123_02021 [Microbacterium sp. MM2322]